MVLFGIILATPFKLAKARFAEMAFLGFLWFQLLVVGGLVVYMGSS